MVYRFCKFSQPQRIAKLKISRNKAKHNLPQTYSVQTRDFLFKNEIYPTCTACTVFSRRFDTRGNKIPRLPPPITYEESFAKSELERQTSFKTLFNPDFDQQGKVGACHIFASLEVVHDVTKGLKLSKEKLFLDHLRMLHGITIKSFDQIVDNGMHEISRGRNCGFKRPLVWEGESESFS